MSMHAYLVSLDLYALSVPQRNTLYLRRKREVTLAHLAIIALEELEKKSSAQWVLTVSKLVERPSPIASLALKALPRI